ncbi:helix-turn-helix domain-containing protein [Gracilibacillus sp. D59]|uniref:helix-turn-helix domain-containing protein n=1 Tax=Gracilibacillus sp. D59 TaxID=3457434 RepID=UPI003FCEAE7D
MDKKRLIEDRSHGDQKFPLKIYEEDHLDSHGVIFGLHWHYEMELTLLEKGPAIFQIGSSSTIVQPGEAVLIQSGQLHAAYPYQDNEFKITAVVFHINLLRSFIYDDIETHFLDYIKHLEIGHPILFRSKSKWEKNILGNLTQIIQYDQTRPKAYKLFIKGLLFQIIAEWMGNYSFPKQPIRDEKTEHIKKVLQYIEENSHMKIKIMDLASLVQMSEGHFNRFFKSFVRMTPVEYINFVRVHHATRLLRETNYKILEISLEVGFDNQSYFIRTFKKHKGCTPSEFRKANGINS